jgi:hypothetical protein
VVDAPLPSRFVWTHDQRLQDAALADAVGQLVDLRLRKSGARVVRVSGHAVQRHEQRMSADRCALIGYGLRGAERRCRSLAWPSVVR